MTFAAAFLILLADLIGNITVPSIAISGSAWPVSLTSDMGYGRVDAPEVDIHLFANTAANVKIEQRFLKGNGARRYTVRRAHMSETDRVTLRNFWENVSGPYQGFPYAVPNDAGALGASVNVRFANEPLTWDFVSAAISRIGLTLIEIPADADAPTYTLNSTVERVPGGTLTPALLAQVQEMVPLVKIVVTDTTYPAIYVSDRRCTIGSQLYLARLLEWDEISQSLGGQVDLATFKFGNADRVMTLLSNDTDLQKATIDFSLFHVQTGIKLDLWKGSVVDWGFDADVTFTLQAADPLNELNLPYPRRKISRTCWKDFNDGITCPAATQGGSNLATPCDKGFDTAAGCAFHTMQNFFGGIVAKPQGVRTKDNSTGTFGFGRNPLYSVSMISDSLYERIVPEIYTDVDFPVNAPLVAGRDEGDFYTAFGIVGEGPVGAFGTGHTLDGQQHHGPGNLGLRRGYGHDPVVNNDPDQDSDKFSLGEGGAGIQTYGAEKAAGTAFIEVRRTDAKGLQLSRLEEHAIQAVVNQGLSGWKWTAPGSRSSVVLTNPVWIAVNIMLRARNIHNASAATQETYFDVAAAVAAAAICDTSVTKLVGSGSETQFKFIGILQEEKPARDWIQEVLMNCHGYFTFAFGKLKIGIRANSSVVEAFTEGNILFNSLSLAPIKPAWNHLTAIFADGEFEFVSNAVTVYDIDHARKIGGAASPLFLKSSLNLSGCSSKSQAARLVAIRNREELGGIYRTDKARKDLEWLAARQVSLRTTVLALNVEPGMVCSITHPDMPTYQASNDGQAEAATYGEFRCTGWRLNKDYSIDITGRSTHNDMYDLVVGPKPADVVADAIPAEEEFAPADWNFGVDARKDGVLRLIDFSCATNPLTIFQGAFEIYYIREQSNAYARLTTDIDADDTSVVYEGEPPVQGEWIQIDSEIMLVGAVTASTANTGTAVVTRAQLGTTGAAHGRATTTVSAKVDNADFTVGATQVIAPGQKLVRDTSGETIGVAEYVSAAGKLRVTLPFAALNVTDTVYADARIYHVTLRNEAIPFQPRFFKSPDRSRFEHNIDMPFSGVVAVRGYLDNTRGFRSDAVIKTFVATFPRRLRTLGTDKIEFTHPALPAGASTDLFESIRPPRAASFGEAAADIVRTGEADTPIATPRGVAAITPAALTYTGTITVGFTVAPPQTNGRILVEIGNGTTDKNYVAAPVFAATSAETTAELLAAALTNFLNAQAEFNAFYTAVNVGTPVVRIYDRTARGGTIACTVSGNVSATPSGLTSSLGILTGRRYAVAFYSAVGLSALSPLSQSSGPTGGFTRVEIKDMPIPTDTRITDVRLYSPPDGSELPWPHSPYYLVASIASPFDYSAVDSIAESILASQSPYPGPSGPTQTGVVKVTVNRDDAPWFELRIPTTAAQSNRIDGLALGPVREGEIITADVDNDADAGTELKIAIQ